MSAITLLGTPQEIYRFGTQYILLVLAYPFVMGSAAHFYLPVFWKLQVSTSYEVRKYVMLSFLVLIKRLIEIDVESYFGVAVRNEFNYFSTLNGDSIKLSVYLHLPALHFKWFFICQLSSTHLP